MNRHSAFQAIIFLLLLAAVLPFLFGIARGYDFAHAHQRWAANFISQFNEGEIYPRWLSGMNGGLGSPVFFIYAPLPFHIASLLTVLIPNLSSSRSLDFAAALSLLLSFVTCALWIRRRLRCSTSGLCAGIAYLYFPYHYYLESLHGYAFAEMWGVAIAPLVLFSWEGIKARIRFSTALLSLSTALVILSHPLTAVPLSLFIAGDFIYSRKLQSKTRTIPAALVSVITGLLLSSIYLLPAHEIAGYVASNVYWEGEFHFSKRTAFTSGIAYFVPRTIEVILLLFAFTVFFASRAGTQIREKKLILLLTLVLSFLITPLSYEVWDNLFVLQVLQSPARFMIALALLCALLAGELVRIPVSIEGDRIAAGSYLITVLLFCLIALTLPLLPALGTFGWPFSVAMVLLVVGAVLCTVRFTHGFSWLGDRRIITADILLACLLLFQILPFSNELRLSPTRVPDNEARYQMCRPEYRPTDVPVEFFREDLLLDHYAHNGEHYLSDRKLAQVSDWRARHITLNITADGPRELTIGQFYMQGWRARVGDTVLPIAPEAGTGMISMSLPSGSYNLDLELPQLESELQGKQLSLAGLILLGIQILAGLISPGKLLK